MILILILLIFVIYLYTKKKQPESFDTPIPIYNYGKPKTLHEVYEENKIDFKKLIPNKEKIPIGEFDTVIYKYNNEDPMNGGDNSFFEPVPDYSYV